MKKIGIMSMHRIKNYGSFLQAYGLKKTIQKLGYDVDFVDYEYQGDIIPKQRKAILKKILRNINIFAYIKKKINTKKYNDAFEKKYIPELCNNKLNLRPKNIYKLVIGSDEVFNCLQSFPVGYSKELFGKNYEDISVISYAACFGHTTLKELKKYNIDSEISILLNNFDSISVRDKNSFEIVKALTNNKHITLNLDPVLITNYDKEIIDNVKLKNYIILYAYPGRLTKKEEKTIKNFARRHNKKIISIGGYQRIADVNLVIHPFEIFAYFRHADFIITDTFHGTIFSIKTHSNYCVIVRNGAYGNNNKLKDLLDRLKQNYRIVGNIKEIEKYYNSSIDFSETDSIIYKETKKAIQYLEKNLNKGR